MAVQNYVRIYFDEEKKDYKDAVMCRLKGLTALGSKLAPGGKFLRGPLYIFSKKEFMAWRQSRYFTPPVSLEDKEISVVNKGKNAIPKEDDENKSKSGSGKSKDKE